MRLRVGLLAGTIAMLASAAPAVAGSLATRFAEPNGNGPEPCAQADPCDIQVAVEDAPPGSPVILATGGPTPSAATSCRSRTAWT